MQNKPLRSIQGITISLATLGLAMTALPVTANFYPDSYRLDPSEEDFQVCASELLAAGIEQADAAVTCARTLRPTELSQCVLNVEQATELAGEDILARCQRVRRPMELSTCLTNINSERSDAIAINVLDYCRRSALPIRFSSCVLGVGREINFESTTVALEACSSAGDRLNNEEVLPDFIFRENNR